MKIDNKNKKTLRYFCLDAKVTKKSRLDLFAKKFPRSEKRKFICLQVLHGRLSRRGFLSVWNARRWHLFQGRSSG